MYFDHLLADRKTEPGRLRLDRAPDRRRLELAHLTARLADQELALVRRLRLRAADISVQAFQAMHQALRHQEVERAIDRRGLGRAVLAAQLRQQIVGLDRRVALPDQLEHAAAQAGQPGAAAGAQLARPIQSGIDAGAMIVIGDQLAPPCHGSLPPVAGHVIA